MYLAHEGVALAATAVEKRLPLWACLLAAEAFDLTGAGHWLPFALLIAGISFEVGRRLFDSRAGLVLAATVLSHDILDLVVGVQVLPGGRYIGLNLAARSSAEVSLEVLFIFVGWLAYRGSLNRELRGRPSVFVPLALLLGFTAVGYAVDTTPADSHESNLSVLVVRGIGLLVTLGVLWQVDRVLRPRRISD